MGACKGNMLSLLLDVVCKPMGVNQSFQVFSLRMPKVDGSPQNIQDAPKRQIARRNAGGRASIMTRPCGTTI